jgi:hypothetical protein
LEQIDSGKREEAIKSKKKQAALMKSAWSMAPSNMAQQVMYEACEQNLQEMEQEKDIRVVRKKQHYEGYLRRKNSTSSIQALSGISAQADDSSEGEAPQSRSRSRTPSPTKRINQKPAQASPAQAPAQAQEKGMFSSVSSFLGLSKTSNDNNK